MNSVEEPDNLERFTDTVEGRDIMEGDITFDPPKMIIEFRDGVIVTLISQFGKDKLYIGEKGSAVIVSRIEIEEEYESYTVEFSNEFLVELRGMGENELESIREENNE